MKNVQTALKRLLRAQLNFQGGFGLFVFFGGEAFKDSASLSLLSLQEKAFIILDHHRLMLLALPTGCMVQDLDVSEHSACPRTEP